MRTGRLCRPVPTGYINIVYKLLTGANNVQGRTINTPRNVSINFYFKQKGTRHGAFLHNNFIL